MLNYETIQQWLYIINFSPYSGPVVGGCRVMQHLISIPDHIWYQFGIGPIMSDTGQSLHWSHYVRQQAIFTLVPGTNVKIAQYLT